jgi:hypothetical protein
MRARWPARKENKFHIFDLIVFYALNFLLLALLIFRLLTHGADFRGLDGWHREFWMLSDIAKFRQKNKWWRYARVELVDRPYYGFGILTDMFKINLLVHDVNSDKYFMTHHFIESKDYVLILLLFCCDLNTV